MCAVYGFENLRPDLQEKRICSPVILEDPEAVLDCFARLMAAKAAETKQQTPGLELSISPRCTRGLGRLAALIQATSREALVLLPALDRSVGDLNEGLATRLAASDLGPDKPKNLAPSRGRTAGASSRLASR